jgi:hypothetical protein
MSVLAGTIKFFKEGLGKIMSSLTATFTATQVEEKLTSSKTRPP